MKNFLYFLILPVIGFIVGLIFCNKMVLELDGYQLSSLIISIVVAIFIVLQCFYNKILTDFTVMPSVGFSLRSGKTQAEKEGKDSSLLGNILDIRYLVKNSSKFPIDFSLKINLERKDKTSGKSSIATEYNWKFGPDEGMNGHDKKLLGVSIFGEGFKIEDINDTVFYERIRNIQTIIAHIEISYTHHFLKQPKNKIKEEWTFDLENFRWKDAKQTSDENITFFNL